MKSLSKLAILIPFVIFLKACSPGEVETTETDTKKSKKLEEEVVFATYEDINKRLDSSWYILNVHEEEKLNLIKRVIKEISYNPKHSPVRLKKLAEKTEDVQERLLTQEALEQDDAIDKYDMLIDSLIEQTITIVEETPDMKNYQNVESLIIEINQLNTDAVLSDRTDYSLIVTEYNEFVDSNKTALKEQNLPIKKKHSFFIME